MNAADLRSSENQDFGFIPSRFLPPGKDQYHIRDKQTAHWKVNWRKLTPDEIDALKKNLNSADDWNSFYVTDEFDPGLIRNSRFFGMIRIGNLSGKSLEYKNFILPAGISNSTIVNCDIGHHAAIHNVNYLAQYIIEHHSLLINNGEITVGNHAKFGTGIVKDGENEDSRNWIHIMNENGGRRILPFIGMNTSDAFLWGKFRDDKNLQQELFRFTQKSFDSQRGYYGIIGTGAVIKNSACIKDTCLGPFSRTEGAGLLENITVLSSEIEQTFIGYGVQLVNGVAGYGCIIDSASQARHFILGDHVTLKSGARVSHSVIGDNSTIACCEISNNLIFPAHEQHHNNSFLIASLIMGQSNIAAGATVGSNHNSRANDNEIKAGRGFWPGLCVSLKHSSSFASFVLLAKADFPSELIIPLPFSLVINNTAKDRLEILPAYWWLYNMYAMARNPGKFKKRDKRIRQSQHIEFDTLAPDTVEEMMNAISLLEIWTAREKLKTTYGSRLFNDTEKLKEAGSSILMDPTSDLKELIIKEEHLENSRRDVLILKPKEAYKAYKEMIRYYALTNVLNYLNREPGHSLKDMNSELKTNRRKEWTNLGGQVIKAEDLIELRQDIGKGLLTSWQDIHERYDELWKRYSFDKQQHAYAVWCDLTGNDAFTPELLRQSLNELAGLQQYICDQVILTRKKDFKNPFNQSTFGNIDEMEAVVGTLDDNEFIQQIKQDTDALLKTIDAYL